MKKIMLLFVLLIVSVTFMETYAGPKTFKGSLFNKNWSVNTNWVEGSVPATGDIVTINNNCNIDAAAAMPDSLISLTINSGYTLKSASLNPIYIVLSSGNFVCNGVLGVGTSEISLYFRNSLGSTQEISGTGTINLYTIGKFANNGEIDIKSDVTLLNTGNVLELINPINLTLKLAAGKTLNVPNGYISFDNVGDNDGSSPGAGGTFIIEGTVNANYFNVFCDNTTNSGNVAITLGATGTLTVGAINFPSNAGTSTSTFTTVSGSQLVLTGTNPMPNALPTNTTATLGGDMYLNSTNNQTLTNLYGLTGNLYFQGSGTKTLTDVYNSGAKSVFVEGTASLVANANVTASVLNIGNTASASLNDTTALTSVVLGTSSTLNLNNTTTTITNGLSAANSAVINSSVFINNTITPISILGNAALNLSALLNCSDFHFGSTTPLTTGSYLHATTLYYEGSSALTTGNELSNIPVNLSINNAAGVTLTKNVTLTTGTLTFINGNLFTGNYGVTLGVPGNLTGETNLSHLIGRISYTTLGTSLTAGTYFDLNLPADITATSGTLVVNRLTGNSAFPQYVEGDGKRSIFRYYEISGTGLAYSGGNITLNWYNVELNGKSMSSAIDFMQVNGVTQWTFLNDVLGVNLGSGSQSTFSLASTIPPAFTGRAVVTFTVSDASNALPVELTTFAAKTNKTGVILNWETATEVSNHGFDVERALMNADGKVGEFAKLGFVNGNGNSNSPKSYNFVDNKAVYGQYVYRLKQIDTDGKFEYSKTVEANVNNLPSTFVLDQNYPNPFNPSTTIKFSVPQSSFVNISVYNMLGEKVATLLNETRSEGAYEMSFNASNLSSGNYVYVLTAGSTRIVKKMTLIK